MIKRADMLTTDAQHVLERLVFFGASEEKVKIINFGIETHFFTKKPFEMKFRQKIFKGINEDDPIIISLRNHEKVYDIQTLIESIPKVLEKIPNARFAIGGSGSLTQQHVSLADKLSVSKNINFFGSYLHDELPNLFGQTSLYVSTSLSDAGLSASTAEAMACEVPVIISDSGENGVWITEGVNGNMFEVKDSSRLAELIIENLFNVDIAYEKGIKGREVIVMNNDVSNEMNKMNNFYSSL
jgi:glycosyltransferase involved in cell wall biosynthesis